MATPAPAEDAAVPDPLLRKSLTSAAATGLSGVLQVIGDPGGTIHLSGGGITGADTPGAPGLEVIALRSGRVAEESWDAAFSASAAGTTMAGELTARGLLGAGELEAVARVAVADALYVLACGYVDRCRAEPGPASCLLPLDPPAGADWLLAEAERRMAVLAAMPGLAGYQRARFRPAPGAVAPGTVLGGGRDELLALANGRRTARDLAFALGRGVYATTLQLGRMRQEGLLVTVSHRLGRDLGDPPGPAGPPGPAAAQPVPGSEPAGAEGPGASGLPRRRKKQPEPPRRTAEPDGDTDVNMLLRLLRPRTGGS